MTQELGRLPPPTQSGLRATASACLSTGGSTPYPPATNGSNSARRFATRTTRGTSTTSTPTSTTWKKWAREAKNAGMRYFVVTTKHHDGFCLWDSDLTDYKVTNTPWGEDLIAPMVEAFRAEGMKVGFYHSLIDWHHPEFPVDGLHPGATTKSTSRPTRPRHRPLPRVPARPDPRAPDPLWPGRCHVVRLLLLGPGLGRQGQGRLGL